ncbi:MAG: fibronectin type III domain-containing protein, partial [Deltaproteobacteria bacterium]|nr:fibronectin type III domain-containing protein [Deltaproteobacteria bacterium]
ETEYTVCQDYAPDPDYPEVTVGAVAAGDSFEIGMGEDENGFGRIWNKTTVDMAELNGELYLAVGHNYEDGSRIWKTDNLTWAPSSDYSFGLLHGYDPTGNPTGVCLVEGYEDSVGNPVSSSVTHFIKSSVSGAETLYAGATGTTGCNGRGARMVRLDNATWHYIVDNFVDDNDLGTNENGFGDAKSFISANFQAWSFAEYDNSLIAGVARLTGGRLLVNATGGTEDDAWKYIVGGDAAIPNGFDGVSGLVGYGANIGPNLYSFDNALYAGTLMVQTSRAFPGSPEFDGSDIWRATGPADALVWSRVTGDGFGDTSIHNFESFCAYENKLYVAASNLFSANPGQIVPDGDGAKIYRLKEVPQIADIASLEAVSARFQTTLTWTSTAEPDCQGYNVYRSRSEKKNARYRKINRSMIPAGASGGAYSFTDYFLRPGKTYFYKIECVGASGSTFIGPLAATTKKLFGADQ